MNEFRLGTDTGLRKTDIASYLRTQGLKIVSGFDGSDTVGSAPTAQLIAREMRGNEQLFSLLRGIAAEPQHSANLDIDGSYEKYMSVGRTLQRLRDCGILTYYPKSGGMGYRITVNRESVSFLSKDAYQIAVCSYLQKNASPDEIYFKVILESRSAERFNVDCIYRIRDRVYFVLINMNPRLPSDRQTLEKQAGTIKRIRGSWAVVVSPNINIDAVKNPLHTLTGRAVKAVKIDTLYCLNK